jgi:hypothetical protein
MRPSDRGGINFLFDERLLISMCQSPELNIPYYFPCESDPAWSCDQGGLGILVGTDSATQLNGPEFDSRLCHTQADPLPASHLASNICGADHSATIDFNQPLKSPFAPLQDGRAIEGSERDWSRYWDLSGLSSQFP